MIFPADTKLEFIQLWAQSSASSFLLHDDKPMTTPAHLVLIGK
jgi:hypothetical protein